MKGPTVRALRLEVRHPRALLAIVGGRLRSQLYHGGAGSPLRLVAVPRPHRPDGWVRIRPTLSGICGSDLKTLRLLDGLSPTITALTGFPRAVIPGHEIVGRVVEAPAGTGLTEGDRVVVDPSLGCEDKGRAPCPRCRDGQPHLCHELGRPGHLTAGHGAGYHPDYGGGWSEEVVAPTERVFPVPDQLDDRMAVFGEPMGVAVQAVAQGPPSSGDHVLVIGPGTIGLCVVHALRALVPDVTVTVAGLSEARDRLARDAGATGLLHGTRRQLIESAAVHLGTATVGSRLSGFALTAGFDQVYDCIGSAQTLDDAMRLTRPRGSIVLVGTAGRQKADWTLVWLRDLTIRGTYAYGVTEVPPAAAIPPGRRHAIAAGIDVLAVRRPELLTHVFELDDPVPALETAAAGPAADAVKVAFAP